MTNPAHRSFLSYIDRSREYYAHQGYDQPYRWATEEDPPAFTPLGKPLSECTVGVVSTTKPSEEHKLRPFAAPSSPVPDHMFTNHLFWHKTATTTDDVGSFLPLERLHALAEAGTIGAVSPRFYGAPTVYSQRRSRRDAAEIADWCRADNVDLVLLHPL